MIARALPLLLVAATLSAGDGLGDEAALRKRGLKALGEVLRHLDSKDGDRSLRARRLAKLIASDHYRAATPAGMRVVPGRLVVTPEGVRPEGGLYLGAREVTVAEFGAFARETGLRAGPWATGGKQLPVVFVTLEEARAYAKWRSCRLPTLDELKQAATGGGKLRYPWGDRFDPRRLNSREGAAGRREAGGSRPLGRSADGIDDLLGNVAEWSESTNSRKGERLRYLVGGGSYRGRLKAAAFVTYKMRASDRLVDVGFRVARSLPTLKPG